MVEHLTRIRPNYYAFKGVFFGSNPVGVQPADSQYGEHASELLAFEKSRSKQNGLGEALGRDGISVTGNTVRSPGGTLEISRWRQPPGSSSKTTPPRRGGGSRQDTRVPSPLPGRVCLRERSGG
jgi:hypothetical protein